MKSKVYFIPVKDSNDTRDIFGNIRSLLETSRLLDIIRKNYKVAVKIHFGEEGNTGFVRPEYARVICDSIIAKGASAFLCDTNTLYRGKRTNSKDHLALARRHGFTKKSAGVEIVIPDETNKKDKIEIKIDNSALKTAKIARCFIDADAIVAINHFKGHILTGFGGALKNIGMGCATRDGKLAQHCDISPVVHEGKCAGCGECFKVCPANAVRIVNNKSVIDKLKCIGCASCIEACPTMAMFIDFGAGDEVQNKMVEYAAAVLKEKKGKAAFINFAIRINKECDCWSAETPRIAPDIGILASTDPVSIDKASFDLVVKRCGKDIFKEAHPDRDGARQLEHAEELGIGNLDYELIELQ